MIRRVKLENFTCHENTELQFPEGLTIFLGRNGAGKSSVVDAITYALYGEHSRGNNTNIVRDGAGGGQVELEFSLGGVDYMVVRQFNSRGALEHSYLRDNGKILATGERRREGDDVSLQIRGLLGISYNQMLSAVVIQQGELDRILSEEPKEIKNLFDELMGMTKMEEAYGKMPHVLKDFENRIYERTGWSLNDLKKVEEELENKRRNLENNLKQRQQLEKEIDELRKKLSEKNDKYYKLKEVKELHDKARSLLTILKSEVSQAYVEALASLTIFENYSSLEKYRKTVDSNIEKIDALEDEKKKKELELRKKEGELDGIEDALQKLKTPKFPKNALPLEKLKAKTREKAEKLKNDSIELGKRLASKQGDVKKLKEQVRKDIGDIVEVVSESFYAGSAQEVIEIIENRKRLLDEQKQKEERIEDLRREINTIDERIEKLSYINGTHIDDLKERIRDAEREVKRLGGMEKKPKIQDNLTILQNVLKILKNAEKLHELPKIEDLKELEVVLDDDETLHNLRVVLEKSITPYNTEELEELEKSRDVLNTQLGERKTQLEYTETTIKQLEGNIKKLEKAKRELAEAVEFYGLLQKIREKIYYRDGPVLKSIRSWVLREVANKAVKYLGLFDVRISDITLEEKGRGIFFGCSYGGRKVDSKRLSGGEKVALALAIRLAISDVLGAGKFGFFILDEPTVHLDSENKKKLQEVFASLEKAVRQAIIITHDEEIFEGADAMIIRFERGPKPNAPTQIRVM